MHGDASGCFSRCKAGPDGKYDTGCCTWACNGRNSVRSRAARAIAVPVYVVDRVHSHRFSERVERKRAVLGGVSLATERCTLRHYCRPLSFCLLSSDAYSAPLRSPLGHAEEPPCCPGNAGDPGVRRSAAATRPDAAGAAHLVAGEETSVPLNRGEDNGSEQSGQQRRGNDTLSGAEEQGGRHSTGDTLGGGIVGPWAEDSVDISFLDDDGTTAGIQQKLEKAEREHESQLRKESFDASACVSLLGCVNCGCTAIAQANRVIPSSLPAYYFEVSLVSFSVLHPASAPTQNLLRFGTPYFPCCHLLDQCLLTDTRTRRENVGSFSNRSACCSGVAVGLLREGVQSRGDAGSHGSYAYCSCGLLLHSATNVREPVGYTAPFGLGDTVGLRLDIKRSLISVTKNGYTLKVHPLPASHSSLHTKDLTDSSRRLSVSASRREESLSGEVRSGELNETSGEKDATQPGETVGGPEYTPLPFQPDVSGLSSSCIDSQGEAARQNQPAATAEVSPQWRVTSSWESPGPVGGGQQPPASLLDTDATQVPASSGQTCFSVSQAPSSSGHRALQEIPLRETTTDRAQFPASESEVNTVAFHKVRGRFRPAVWAFGCCETHVEANFGEQPFLYPFEDSLDSEDISQLPEGSLSISRASVAYCASVHHRHGHLSGFGWEPGAEEHAGAGALFPDAAGSESRRHEGRGGDSTGGDSTTASVKLTQTCKDVACASSMERREAEWGGASSSGLSARQTHSNSQGRSADRIVRNGSHVGPSSNADANVCSPVSCTRPSPVVHLKEEDLQRRSLAEELHEVMGGSMFPLSLCVRSLERTGDDIQAAAEWLLENGLEELDRLQEQFLQEAEAEELNRQLRQNEASERRGEDVKEDDTGDKSTSVFCTAGQRVGGGQVCTEVSGLSAIPEARDEAEPLTASQARREAAGRRDSSTEAAAERRRFKRAEGAQQRHVAFRDDGVRSEEGQGFPVDSEEAVEMNEAKQLHFRKKNRRRKLLGSQERVVACLTELAEQTNRQPIDYLQALSYMCAATSSLTVRTPQEAAFLSSQNPSLLFPFSLSTSFDFPSNFALLPEGLEDEASRAITADSFWFDDLLTKAFGSREDGRTALTFGQRSLCVRASTGSGGSSASSVGTEADEGFAESCAGGFRGLLGSRTSHSSTGGRPGVRVWGGRDPGASLALQEKRPLRAGLVVVPILPEEVQIGALVQIHPEAGSVMYETALLTTTDRERQQGEEGRSMEEDRGKTAVPKGEGESSSHSFCALTPPHADFSLLLSVENALTADSLRPLAGRCGFVWEIEWLDGEDADAAFQTVHLELQNTSQEGTETNDGNSCAASSSTPSAVRSCSRLSVHHSGPRPLVEARQWRELRQTGSSQVRRSASDSAGLVTIVLEVWNRELLGSDQRQLVRVPLCVCCRPALSAKLAWADEVKELLKPSHQEMLACRGTARWSADFLLKLLDHLRQTERALSILQVRIWALMLSCSRGGCSAHIVFVFHSVGAHLDTACLRMSLRRLPTPFG